MCGIAGYVDSRMAPGDGRAALEIMCAALVHRGPDDQGIAIERGAGLGMRRLSIIDLAGGHQPIASADGTRTIVFNGEIYNYRDLRRDLIARGRRFQTNSDTEVVLQLYEEEGPACVNRLNGMFAFAIWDAPDQSLFIARDRLGVKPLYYHWDGRRLIFASELKAIVASGMAPRTLNELALWDYLTFRYVPQPETIWADTYKLPPAHTLTLRPGSAPRIDRYWDIPVTDGRTYDGDAVAEFTTLFLDAVRLRLIADVPVGILLSGGLDSSAVAAAVAETHNARLASFSVAFDDPGAIDETPFAREVARHVGTDHHEIRIGAREFLDYLPLMVRATDEPLADLASVPLYYVSGLARSQVKVVLSGEGSDEILGGYDFDRVIKQWTRGEALGRAPSWMRRSARAAAALIDPALGDRLERAMLPAVEAIDAFPPSMTNYLDSSAKNALWRGHAPLRDSIDVVRAALERARGADPLGRVLYSYCQSWLVEDLLMKADKMTMAQSLELRVPFLDYRLVEWAARLPACWKVGRDAAGAVQTKRVLRKFAETRLPARIINREKQGFPVPVYGWLSTRLHGWAHEALGGETMLSRWLRSDGIRRQLAAGTRSGAPDLERHRLWNLLVLELWMREWQPE